MKRSWIRNLFTRPVTRPIRKASPRKRLGLEALEDRVVPATFTVLNTNDSGAGSLRAAVLSANGNAGPDTIVFGDGSGTGGTNFLDATPDTITLTSGQLTLTDTATTTITGTGASLLSISGNNTSRVFTVNTGASAARPSSPAATRSCSPPPCREAAVSPTPDRTTGPRRWTMATAPARSR